MSKVVTLEDRFFALVRPKPQKKKRHCMRCQKVFISDGAHHRVCAPCKVVNDQMGASSVVS